MAYARIVTAPENQVNNSFAMKDKKMRAETQFFKFNERNILFVV